MGAAASRLSSLYGQKDCPALTVSKGPSRNGVPSVKKRKHEREADEGKGTGGDEQTASSPGLRIVERRSKQEYESPLREWPAATAAQKQGLLNSGRLLRRRVAVADGSSARSVERKAGAGIGRTASRNTGIGKRKKISKAPSKPSTARGVRRAGRRELRSGVNGRRGDVSGLDLLCNTAEYEESLIRRSECDVELVKRFRSPSMRSLFDGAAISLEVQCVNRCLQGKEEDEPTSALPKLSALLDTAGKASLYIKPFRMGVRILSPLPHGPTASRGGPLDLGCQEKLIGLQLHTARGGIGGTVVDYDEALGLYEVQLSDGSRVQLDWVEVEKLLFEGVPSDPSSISGSIRMPSGARLKWRSLQDIYKTLQ